MSDRRNIITGERILFAPSRAGRPGAFIDSPEEERCPFCPGHESDTPPTIEAYGDPWRVRVFPNKYPPVPGAEVIVEARQHDARFAELAHVQDVVTAYVSRYRAHADAAAVALFRNDGERAGQSIAHLHSQLVPLPFAPPRIVREATAFGAAASCPLCAAPERHRAAGQVIEENASFTWLCPTGSSLPLQQWIVPKRHVAELSDLTDQELVALGDLLLRVAAAMNRVASAFNWAFIGFRAQPAAHFYVDVFPRVTNLAGLELSTGTFVEIIDPADAAARLRT